MKSVAFIVLFLALAVPLSWYSWLLGYAHAPGNSGINPLGPLAAALICSLIGGWRGLKAFFGRLLRVRTAWTTYVMALLAPVAVCIAAVAIEVVLSGAPSPAPAAIARWKEAADAFIFIFVFVALGEEPGWRGWLLPRLNGLVRPLIAALIVAPIWALWHLPLMGRDLPSDQIGPFLISLTAASVFLAWLTNRTRGGVLPAMIAHATVNAIGGGFLFTFFAGAAKTQLWWIYAGLWAVLALVVVFATRGRLGLRDEPAAAPAF